MAYASALGVFQERVKAIFGSVMEVLLVEITEAYRESLTERMRTVHCKRCACNQTSDNNKSQGTDEVRGLSRDCDPPVLPEQMDVQQLIPKDKMSDQESPNADGVESKQDVKEENRDKSVKTEEEAQETAHLKESQACQTVVINATKPEDVDSIPITPFQQDSCLPPQSQTQDDQLLLPLRPCFVQLKKSKFLQRPFSQSRQLYVCGICSRVFLFKKRLRRHKRFHTGEKPHNCPLCTKKFIFRKTLQMHIAAHFKRPYSCTQCKKRFRHWKKLSIHWRAHAGESPFFCNLCGKSFRTLKRLDWHLANINHD